MEGGCARCATPCNVKQPRSGTLYMQSVPYRLDARSLQPGLTVALAWSLRLYLLVCSAPSCMHFSLSTLTRLIASHCPSFSFFFSPVRHLTLSRPPARFLDSPPPLLRQLPPSLLHFYPDSFLLTLFVNATSSRLLQKSVLSAESLYTHTPSSIATSSYHQLRLS